MEQKNNKERGSVIFIILIAVALFAALSFATTRGMRGGESGVEKEQAKLLATEIIQYTNSLQTAIQMMQIDGVNDEDISFHADFWGHTDYKHAVAQPEENRVFSPSGGGVNYTKPKDDMNGGADWVFTGDNRASLGSEIGTTEADLIMVLPKVTDSVCAKINDDLVGSETIPDEIDFFSLVKFNGTFAAGTKLDIAETDYADLQMGCLRSKAGAGTTQTAPGKNYFYAVLIER